MLGVVDLSGKYRRRRNQFVAFGNMLSTMQQGQQLDGFLSGLSPWRMNSPVFAVSWALVIALGGALWLFLPPMSCLGNSWKESYKTLSALRSDAGNSSRRESVTTGRLQEPEKRK